MLIVYLSLTGNTRRFVEKLDMKSLELEHTEPFVEVDEDYVVIIPTYSDTISDIVCDFIDFKNNRKFLKGIVGGGEKNFGSQYIFSAKDVSREYSSPLVFNFEKSGTNDDVSNFKKEVQNIEITRTK